MTPLHVVMIGTLAVYLIYVVAGLRDVVDEYEDPSFWDAADDELKHEMQAACASEALDRIKRGAQGV